MQPQPEQTAEAEKRSETQQEAQTQGPVTTPRDGKGIQQSEGQTQGISEGGKFKVLEEISREFMS
jgi:hypothetical protein